MVKQSQELELMTMRIKETRIKWPSMEVCNMVLRLFHWKIQLCSWKLFNQSSHEKNMNVQSFEIHNLRILDSHFWILEHVSLKKVHNPKVTPFSLIVSIVWLEQMTCLWDACQLVTLSYSLSRTFCTIIL
jgi:hypothetical protein